MSHHDKHGALKALDNFYDQLSAIEPRRALLKLYDHARQLARTVDELSSRSATVPPGWKLVCEKCGANQGEACGWPAKCEASAVTETAPTEGIPYVATLKFDNETRVVRGTLSDADIAAICQLDGCRAQRAEADAAQARDAARWIPIKERLPDTDKRSTPAVPVLFVLAEEENNVCAGRFHGRGRRLPWRSLQGAAYRLLEVTHWMPLPNGPSQR